MDVKDYCSGMEIELTAWKARLYDLLRKLSKQKKDDQAKVQSSIEDLHGIIAKLTERIEQLKTECPVDWSPEKKEIEDSYVDMWTKYENLMEAIISKG
jgi:hypothetical protein